MIKGQYVRICEAISRTTAAAATEIAETSSEPRKLRCKSFDAELVERVVFNSTDTDLVPTGEIVPLLNTFQDPMSTDQQLVIAQLADHSWTILVWVCNA